MSAELRSGYKQTEVGVIPQDWDIRSLDSVCDVRDGTHESPRFFKQGIPFVTSKNIIDGRLDLENVSYISEQDATEFDKRSRVDLRDILMSMIGTIGNAVLVEQEPKFCIKNVALIKPQKIDSLFLIQVVNSPLFQKYLSNSLDGGIQKFIALGTLRQLQIQVPEPHEQRAIAEALSDVDDLLAKLDWLIAKNRNLKQVAMQQLLTGQTRLPGSSVEWEVKQLVEICHMKSGEGITSANIDDHSKFPCYGGNGLRGYATRYTHDGSYALIGRQGALCGNVLGVEGKFFASEHAIVVTPLKGTNIQWLAVVLSRMNLNQYSESSAQPGLSVSKLLPISWNVPPLKEQSYIASVLSDMDTEIAALEARRDKTRALKRGMMQELLTGRIRLV